MWQAAYENIGGDLETKLNVQAYRKTKNKIINRTDRQHNILDMANNYTITQYIYKLTL